MKVNYSILLMKSKNIYSPPFEKGRAFLAVSDSRAHPGNSKNAIDFIVEFDRPILAILDGEVVDLKDDATKGGDDEKYTAYKYQNYITIKHERGEFSQYVHLDHRSSLVKIGEKVKRGQPIAKSIGMIGCTTSPHLHLMVYVKKGNGLGFESIDPQFDKKINIIRTEEDIMKELSKPGFERLRKLRKQYTKDRK